MVELVGEQTEAERRSRGRRDLECEISDCHSNNCWENDHGNNGESETRWPSDRRFGTFIGLRWM